MQQSPKHQARLEMPHTYKIAANKELHVQRHALRNCASKSMSRHVHTIPTIEEVSYHRVVLHTSYYSLYRSQGHTQIPSNVSIVAVKQFTPYTISPRLVVPSVATLQTSSLQAPEVVLSAETQRARASSSTAIIREVRWKVLMSRVAQLRTSETTGFRRVHLAFFTSRFILLILHTSTYLDRRAVQRRRYTILAVFYTEYIIGTGTAVV